MIRLAALIAATFAVAACHGTLPESTPPVRGAGQCDAAKVQYLIGHIRSDAVTNAARKRSGARVVRYLTPGMMVTMEYRGDRLNLHLGTDGRIGSATCG